MAALLKINKAIRLLLLITTVTYNVKAGPLLSTTHTLTEEKSSPIQPRAIQTTMEMLEPNRRLPRPKPPLTNDIGMARNLNPSMLPPQALSPVSSEENISTTLPPSTTTFQPTLDPETIAIARELHNLMDNFPTLPGKPIPQIPFQKDPEDEAIDERITEVARQLAEASLWNEYRKSKIPHTFPMPVVKNVETKTTTVVEEISTEKPSIKEISKAGKSLVVPNWLPIVSYLPKENSQLQQISDTQPLQQIIVNEGFYPPTPISRGSSAEEYKSEENETQRTPKSMDNNFGFRPMVKMPLSTYLRMMTSGFNPNELVISVPVGQTFQPAIVSDETKN